MSLKIRNIFSMSIAMAIVLSSMSVAVEANDNRARAERSAISSEGNKTSAARNSAAVNDDSDFLTELRTHFSVNFLQRLHQSAISNYNAIAELPIDEAPEIIWPEDVETLYGCVETRPASGAEQS